MQITTATAPRPLHFLRARTLAARWDCNASTLWRMRQRGELPEPTKLSTGISAWSADVIEAIEAARTPGNSDARHTRAGV